MSYRARVLAKIQRYTPADLDDVVEFRAKAYGPDAFFTRPEYVRWMYERSAALDACASRLWLFRPERSVEGQQGGIRSVLLVRGRPYETLWATELVVSPEYLLRGVGAVLSGLATAEAPVTIGFEVTELAKKAFLRAGWNDLGNVPMYMRPFDVGAVMADRGKRLPSLLTGALNVALRLRDVAASLLTARRSLRLEQTARFDERSAAIWEASAPHYPVIVRRDARTLTWRYVEFPEQGYYRLFYGYRGSDPVAHAVLRVEQRDGHTVGSIVDFLCPPQHAHALLASCNRWFRDQGAAAAYCVQSCSLLGRAFTAAGYLRRSTGWPLMVRAHGLPDHDEAMLSDPANWFITGGDGNVDHPREGTEYAT